jgi:hypothetical protein
MKQTNEERERPIIGKAFRNGTDCKELFDPCTREPIENSDINILERRVRDIKKQRTLDISGKSVFPDNIKNRLDLLLFILNRDEKPNEKLLQYNINGQLYESYWDIVFTLGLIDTFPITKDFYMFNGKIEKLINIDGEGFSNNPLAYLSSKKVNEGAKSGASDITFVYKENKPKIDIDECSADPSIKVINPCSKLDTERKDEGATRPKFFFCSSKYFSSDNSKGVDKFDIQNIYTAAKELKQEYDSKIILLVKDKGAVEEKLRKAIRKYISEEASYVYGMDDLFATLTSLYDFIHTKHDPKEKLTKKTLATILKLESPPKPILRLRLHQYLATYKICDAIESFRASKVSNKFLVGIVPRGGKTFIAGGIIDRLNPKRVVVLLGAKSETLSQFKKDLFEEFQNFADYECVDVVNTTDKVIDPSKKYIFIMSVELYKQSDSTRRLLQELKGKDEEKRANLFICDEAHLKQTTARAVKQMEKGTVAVKDEEEEDVSDEAEESELKELDKQIQEDIPVVYMTGTYIKPLKAFKIPDENVVIWDYQDIQQAKELSTNETYFKENFGELYIRALETCFSYGQTFETIQQQYQKFPELYLLTTQFTPDAKSAFLKQTKGGFPTISHLFEVRDDFNPETTSPETWYTGFTNPKGMIRLLNYLAPPAQQLEEIDGKPIDPISSVLKSVDTIAQRIGDRLGYFTSEFVAHSQLWFLPHMQNNPLYKRMCALAGAIFQSSWFRKYFHIVGVSSSVKWNIPGSEQNSILIKATDGSDSCGTFSWACPTGEKSLKQCLLDQEALARRKGKGLIILAQNMLHLGISLPCVDIVVLLDVGEKVDERIQKMYRALTESTNKKGGYIIDMNYFRTVTAIMNYQITAEKSRKGRKEELPEQYIKTQFNKVLDIFSIDIDKPIYGTHEERAAGDSEIQKMTIPELQKIFGPGAKKTGNSIILEDAGHALNANIETVVEKNYKSSYDDFLGLLKKEELKQKQLRAEGQNVEQAKHEEESNNGDKESSYSEPKIFREGSTEEQKREAYIDIFKTTLKLGVFGTNAFNVKALEEKLSTDEEFRQTLYDTLIKRGAIQGIDTISRDAYFLGEHKQSLRNIKKYMKKIMDYKQDINEFKKYVENKRSMFYTFTEKNKKELLELAESFLKNIENLDEHEQNSINSNINNDEEPINNSSIQYELNRFFTEIEYNKLTEKERSQIEDAVKLSEKKKREHISFIIDAMIRPGLNKMIKQEKNMTYYKMKESVEDETKYPGHVKEVLDYINEHLAPKDLERQKYGEIYTPLRLVDEMLDRLPEEVWTNPDLKWLDPANGMGNYPVMAFLRLLKGLEGKVKDPAKHIVENMLFMIDINGKNNEIARKLFKKLAPNSEPNIEKIDPELGFFANKDFKFNGKTINKFDIIMGNPPYNPPKTETGSSGNSIWQNFVIKSHFMLNNKGYLLFVHPPGWKKPTDEVFKSEKFANGDYTGQIRQGQVWQVLKDSGVFKFIYTNDQKSKALSEEYIDHFPAVDYYVYQKGGDTSGCNTKNVFLGTIEDPKGVKLNYNLKYLPNLITKQTQDILHKITSKEGDKSQFSRFRNGKGFSVDSSKGKYKYIYTYNKKSEPKYQYSDIIGDNNINLNKVIMNFDGGIDCYTIQYVKKEDKIGSYEMTMYSEVKSDKDGKLVEAFFKSNIVKFIFLITQYASGKMTKNEPLVANSITIPPEGTADYYKFFDIEEHKKYIEEILAHYEKFKAPKRPIKTVKAVKPKKEKTANVTRKVCPKGKEPSPVTGNCVKICPTIQRRNPKTGRCKRAKNGGNRNTRKIYKL